MLAATLKLSASPKEAGDPLYVKVICLPSALSTAEKLAAVNPAALVEIDPNETIEPPEKLSVKMNVSPGWSCWVEFGLALSTENWTSDLSPVWKTLGATA
jgi:hypothetical protein